MSFCDIVVVNKATCFLILITKFDLEMYTIERKLQIIK